MPDYNKRTTDAMIAGGLANAIDKFLSMGRAERMRTKQLGEQKDLIDFEVARNEQRDLLKFGQDMDLQEFSDINALGRVKETAAGNLRVQQERGRNTETVQGLKNIAAEAKAKSELEKEDLEGKYKVQVATIQAEARKRVAAYRTQVAKTIEERMYKQQQAIQTARQAVNDIDENIRKSREQRAKLTQELAAQAKDRAEDVGWTTKLYDPDLVSQYDVAAQNLKDDILAIDENLKRWEEERPKAQSNYEVLRDNAFATFTKDMQTINEMNNETLLESMEDQIAEKGEIPVNNGETPEAYWEFIDKLNEGDQFYAEDEDGDVVLMMKDSSSPDGVVEVKLEE